MAQMEPTVSIITHTIQVALAPVFLLSGVAALLNVLTNRLGRIIDRARVLEDRLESMPVERRHANDPLHEVLAILSRRSRMVNASISLCTGSAILVCAVIIALFVGAVTAIDTSPVITLLFVGAMLALIAALVVFLREVFVATASLRIGILDAHQ
jgi:Protein of unknown function (DUF2721)